ncbi:MAG: anhydro-N-acetylmuramic acid kinase [Caldilineaceae bacterium]
MKIIGLMSGTSADGIDAVIAEIGGPPQAPTVRQLAFETVAWPAAERTLIFHLFGHNDAQISATPAELCRANFVLAERFAAAALTVTQNAGWQPQDIDLIGSHGQTIWHDVDAQGGVTSTLQIGEPSVIAARTGITTVANFRTADVAAGGQGAPLTSTFDWLVLRPPPNLNGVGGGWRAVQNIGGIGNVTFLPPADLDHPPVALDTGPGNALIDWAVSTISGGRLTYDKDGGMAAAGRVHHGLMEEWLALPYFDQPLPKTTGRELFSTALAQQWRRQADEFGLNDADFVATLTELTAASIVDAYVNYAPGPVAQLVVGGGGASNPVLMDRLRALLPAHMEVCTHAALGLDDDAKEALAFALLAYLTIHGAPGNVPTCTGAASAAILGQIAPGRNWGRNISVNLRD